MKTIKYIILPIIIVLIGCSNNSTTPNTSANTDIVEDTFQAQLAYVYLNKVRQNPSAYSKECNFDLSKVEARPKLTYNTILEKVAREKCLDMAKRNYMAHQNPEGKGIDHLIIEYGYPLDQENYLVNETTANYESLQSAGTSAGYSTLTGESAIQDLIWDGGGPTGGHREHLLGIGIRSTLDEIGIGFVKCKSDGLYTNYTCVVIAKKKN